MELLEKPPKQKRKILFKCLGLLILLSFGFGMLSGGIRGTDRYLNVQDRAVTVEAVVTDVVEYVDPDSGTNWRVYIKYTYQGREYTAQYEDTGSDEWKNSRGRAVTAEINPDNPGELVKYLNLNARNGVMFGIIALAVAAYVIFRRERQTWTACFGVNRSTIHQELVSMFSIKLGWLSCLLIGLSYLILNCWLSEIFDGFIFALGILFTIIGGLLLIRYIKLMRAIRKQDYRVERDTLVKKEEDYDSDSGTRYYLFYANGDGSWRCRVGRKYFNNAKIGDTTQAVYIPRRKKPIAWFGDDGESGAV